jgi:hypothetical protein
VPRVQSDTAPEVPAAPVAGGTATGVSTSAPGAAINRITGGVPADRLLVAAKVVAAEVAAEEPLAAGTDLAPQPAAWFPDPYERHEHRYWDGASWTAHVADAGSVGTDPLPS